MISICLTSTTTEGTIHHHTHQSHRAAVEPPPDVVRLSRRRTGVMGSTCEGNRRRVRGRGGRRAVGDTRRACLSSCVHINSISVISACLTSRTAEAPLRPTPTTLTLDGAAPPPPETAPSSTPEERQDKVRERCKGEYGEEDSSGHFVRGMSSSRKLLSGERWYTFSNHSAQAPPPARGVTHLTTDRGASFHSLGLLQTAKGSCEQLQGRRRCGDVEMRGRWSFKEVFSSVLSDSKDGICVLIIPQERKSRAPMDEMSPGSAC